MKSLLRFIKFCLFFVSAWLCLALAVSVHGAMSERTVNLTHITHVNSAGIGKIAVRIREPQSARYPEGAPLVVIASGWFTGAEGFNSKFDFTEIDAIDISYLWPGTSDAPTGVSSEGTDDHAGPNCMAALRDVIRFVCGDMSDINGRYINDITSLRALTDNVGIYASSHSGVAATNVMAYYGDQLPGVKYFVGRENPTRDEMYPLEIGHWDEQNGSLVTHPYYRYPQDYTSTSLRVDYSTAGWIVNPQYPAGQPYLERPNGTKHIFGSRGPNIDGRRYFSRALTGALEANSAFVPNQWPNDLATYQETLDFWPYRVVVNDTESNYDLIATRKPQLKVMLLFAVDDHVQTALDKPHVHHAWDGFFYAAELWVRMNPDGVYMEFYRKGDPTGFVERDAGIAPSDWMTVRQWGYANNQFTLAQASNAAVAEMADRVRTTDWRADVNGILYAACLLIPQNLALTIPCFEYDGFYGEVVFDHKSGNIWEMDVNSLTETEAQDGACIHVGEDLRLNIPCAEYQGIRFTVAFNFQAELTWELDLNSVLMK